MVNEFYIPSDLNEEQARKYVKTMEEFSLRDDNSESGKMGSSCYAGQQALAYAFAKGSQQSIEEVTCLPGINFGRKKLLEFNLI